MAGVAHPFTGIDHLLAMAGVGWWSATTQDWRWWTVPLAFVGAPLLGALAGGVTALTGVALLTGVISA